MLVSKRLATQVHFFNLCKLMNPATEQRIAEATLLEKRLSRIESSLDAIKTSLDAFIKQSNENYITKVEFKEVEIRVKDQERFKWVVLTAIVGSIVSIAVNIFKITISL